MAIRLGAIILEEGASVRDAVIYTQTGGPSKVRKFCFADPAHIG